MKGYRYAAMYVIGVAIVAWGGCCLIETGAIGYALVGLAGLALCGWLNWRKQ